MAQQKMKIPIWTRGTVEQLEQALSDGILKNIDRIVWHYVTEGEDAGSLILVYTDKTLHYITDTRLASSISNLMERVTANVENINVLDNSLQAITDALNNYASWAETVNDSLGTLRDDLDSLENRVNTAETTLADLETKSEDYEDRITANENAITINTSAIADNVTAINSNAQEIANQANMLASHSDSLEQINTTINNLTSSVTVIESQVDVEDKTISEYVKDYVDQAIGVDFI